MLLTLALHLHYYINAREDTLDRYQWKGEKNQDLSSLPLGHVWSLPQGPCTCQ